MTASKKPISRKKRSANRRNAQKSTGPRTEAGKRKVSGNAITHGLDAVSHPVVPYESEQEFREFSDAMVRDLQPVGIAQRQIVQQIILLNWKLRRIPAVEAAMLAHLLGVMKEEHTRHKDEGELPADHQLPAVDAAMLVAASFYREEKCQERLEVYQMRLQRGLHAAYRQLEKLREQTAGEEMSQIYQNGCELAEFARLVNENVAAKRAEAEEQADGITTGQNGVTSRYDRSSASGDSGRTKREMTPFCPPTVCPRLVDENVAAKHAEANEQTDMSEASEQETDEPRNTTHENTNPQSKPETRHPNSETRPKNQNLEIKATADADWPKSRPENQQRPPAADFKCAAARTTGSSFQR